MKEYMRFEKIMTKDNFSKEDGGAALLFGVETRVYNPSLVRLANKIGLPLDELNQDKGIWIKLISWDESREHKDFKDLIGRKIRVIIETEEVKGEK